MEEPTLPSGHPRQRHQHRRPIQLFPYAYLLLPPLLLAFLTATFLYLRSDVNLALLYSQCHARARVPFLSRIPVLGAPACYLVSFFQEALGGGAGPSSRRALAVMAEVLASLAGLLSVSLVEAARACNAPAALLAYPTGWWLVFNLAGGAFVWELAVVPASFHRSQQILAARGALDAGGGGGGGGERGPEGEPGAAERQARGLADADRNLRAAAEAVAIPAAVLLGFVVPSLLMLFLHRTPAVVLAWLFFPVYVALVRLALRTATIRLSPRLGVTHHLESHGPSLAAVYAVPVALSVAAHGWALWSLLAGADDRREVTRSALQFVEVDFVFVALTVLYWVTVEAGPEAAGVLLAFSILLGPGAGVCIGWYVREQAIGGGDHPAPVISGGSGPGTEGAGAGAGADAGTGGGDGGGDDGGGPEAGEETPLLQ